MDPPLPLGLTPLAEQPLPCEVTLGVLNNRVSAQALAGECDGTLLSPGGLALPPFYLPPFTVSPGA
eukprot:scaffold24481_cov125-Isochrysis_galbana.AAC.3